MATPLLDAARELDMMAQAADRNEPIAPAPGAPESVLHAKPFVPAVIDYAAEARSLVDFVADSLAPFYPHVGAVFTPERRASLAAGWGPLLAKYGVTLGDLFGKWAPEIGAFIATAPLVAPLLTAIRRERAQPIDKPAESQPASHAPAPPPPDPPGTGTPIAPGFIDRSTG